MISVNFEYHRATTISEAVEIYENLSTIGKKPLYLNGGTEIITLMRVQAAYTNAAAVIDIKHIPECKFIGFEGDRFTIGASVPLAKIEEMTEFPLLSKVSSRIADHTSREKITVGGNICGNIQYKEAILPLLLTDCELVIASKLGVETVSIHQVFDPSIGQIVLEPGSLIVQIKVERQYLTMPFISKKILSIGRIGYPLLTVSAIKVEEKLRFAITGLCEIPFRSHSFEAAINEGVTAAMSKVPGPIVDDASGSAAYRAFVLQNFLEETMQELKGGTSN